MKEGRKDYMKEGKKERLHTGRKEGRLALFYTVLLATAYNYCVHILLQYVLIRLLKKGLLLIAFKAPHVGL